ncbi:mCG142216 [Mus musculus]|uniref:Uncharacterized protein n=1 Tax=Mus musculus TaxID=10090 RepID=Q9D5C5_MOUSE|nr:mCG142216 [Mus musculus]BAB29873.1 unnamed protein product [Mus musculus]BAC36410.1 unnamed protein product [Mus musculus]
MKYTSSPEPPTSIPKQLLESPLKVLTRCRCRHPPPQPGSSLKDSQDPKRHHSTEGSDCFLEAEVRGLEGRNTNVQGGYPQPLKKEKKKSLQVCQVFSLCRLECSSLHDGVPGCINGTM